MPRALAKYEGLGNDFIVLDALDWPESDVTPSLAQVLCDRHRGIGADGILWLAPSTPEASAARAVRLVIFNADGSRPEMCGNGVRCVAAWMHDRGDLAIGERMVIETDAGPRAATVNADGTVRVDMGEVRIEREPVLLDVDAAHVRAIAVDVGNPHAVLFDARGDERAVVSAAERRTDQWPRGVNVEFVNVDPNGGFTVRVHERGVGWTQACGTGACAVAAAAVLGDRGARIDEPVPVRLEGGTLIVTIRRVDGRLRAEMSGPATRVFAGEPSRALMERLGA